MFLRTKDIFLIFILFFLISSPGYAVKFRLPSVPRYHVKLVNHFERQCKKPGTLSTSMQFVLPKGVQLKGFNFKKRTSFTVPNAEAVKHSLAAHGYYESAALARQYQRNLDKFLIAKKDLDIFLIYQELEPRSLNDNEKSYYSGIVDEAEDGLAGMEKILGVRYPAIHYGTIWLNSVRKKINPMLNTFVPEEEFFNRDLTHGRQFDENEFLLKGTDGKSLIFREWKESSALEAQRLAQELPPLTIAVLNDDPEIIEWVQIAAARGFMGKGARVKGFDSMSKLLDLLKGGVKYDLILLDYVLEDGISLYVANQLRAMGDDRTILLVNSALMEDEVPSQDLFHQGIDGFISSVGFRRDNVGPRLAHSLHNYFFYKNKHGWYR